MRSFWDERAREDAFFFVDDRLEYGRPDRERFWREGERDLLALLEAAGAGTLGAGDEAVEIGCGLGRLTRALAARVASVQALDVSPEMLRRARELNRGLDGNVRWRLGDGVSLAPVADASADLCVSHVVFQHLPDPALTLGYVREMGRVLRPGGIAVFQLSTDPGVHRRAAPASGDPGARRWRSRRTGRGPRGREDPAWLGSAVDLADLRATALQAGLEVESLSGEGTQFCVARLRRHNSGSGGCCHLSSNMEGF